MIVDTDHTMYVTNEGRKGGAIVQQKAKKERANSPSPSAHLPPTKTLRVRGSMSRSAISQ